MARQHPFRARCALAIVGGVLGINTEANGDRLQAVGMGALLLGIGLVLRTLGGRRSERS